MRWSVILFAVIVAGAAGWYVIPSGAQETGGQTGNTKALAAVTVPASFTEQERTGAHAYDAVCAACHGPNGQGQNDVAPPLVHKIYEPGHHGDMAFVMAAQNGVRSHHWKFGNMPPVEGVTKDDILNIVAYIRALQRANGID